jgi:hypothetical protein
VLITIETIEHLLTPEQQQIIAQIIDVLLPDETLRRLTWVRIEEVPEGKGGVRISFAISGGADRVSSG